MVDRTGISGRFDFAFEYAYPQRIGPGDSVEPAMLADLFAALQQQLGLQLVSKKIPFDTVVVESVDKVPTEN